MSSLNLQDKKRLYPSWYGMMLLIRKFEDRAAQLYGQQKIRGFCHLYHGQEAGLVGIVSALKQGDKYITAYRDHGHPLALGVDPGRVMAELFGKIDGLSKGHGGSMHMFDREHHFLGGHAIVGGQVPIGVGIAFAEKYRQSGYVCVVFMGDGAVWQGCVHESWNLAALYRLPVIFVIENNGYAMGTSVARSTRASSLCDLVKPYGMVSCQVDGLCVESVYHAIKQQEEYVREGNPILVELLTYRYKGHSVSDPAHYRSREEVESYKKKDPIERLRAKMVEEQWVSQEDLEEIDQAVKVKIQEAVDFADQSPYPDPSMVYRYVYKQEDYPFLKC